MSRQSEIVYGLHAVRHALLRHPESVRELWIQEGKRPGAALQDILRVARQHGIEPQYRPVETLDVRTEQGVHQGAVLVRHLPAMPGPGDLDGLLDSLAGREALLLVLEGVQDPHNLGACLRTANAAGVDAVILPRDRSVPVTAAVRKVASGAAEQTPVITVANLARSLRQLKQAGIWLLGTADEAEQELYSLDLARPLAIVMGSEGGGLRQNTRRQCDYLARVPMLGTVESLNVTVAAGVCLYEAIRQRSARDR